MPSIPIFFTNVFDIGIEKETTKVERKQYIYEDLTSEELDRLVQQAMINDPYDVKLWAKISVFKEWKLAKNRLIQRAFEISDSI